MEKRIAIFQVPIFRDMAEVLFPSVGEHEISLLEELHGPMRIKKDSPVAGGETMAMPDPDEEYERLARLYGSDPESGLPYVKTVYRSPDGLAEALRKFAVEVPEPEVAKVIEAPKGKAKVAA